MEKEQIFDKRLIFVIIGILLVCAVGVSFAYFVGGDRASGDGSQTTGVSDELIKVTYDAGSSALNATDLYPGKSASKTFTVNVKPSTADTTAKYQVYLNITGNTFVYCTDSNYNSSNLCTKSTAELTYNLKDSTGSVIATGNLTEKTGKVVLKEETKTVSAETNYSYTLEILFNDTGADQNHNINKSIVGNVKVELIG